MGKKQHQSDKLYLTAKEWSHFYGGRRPDRSASDPDAQEFRRLPFDHCALSLQPWSNPYCDEDGHIFDLVHIVPFIKKYKLNPITGQPLDAKKLTKLVVHKNAEGHYHCPVLYKVFNNNSHIVTVKNTGNVFSFEAVEELNFKTKNFKDLLSSEPFMKKDVIILQDPTNYSKFNLSNFHHLKHNLKVENDELERAKTDSRARLKAVNNETKVVLAELDRTYQSPDLKPPVPGDSGNATKADKFNAAPYSKGLVAASFTSTAFERKTEQEAAVLEDDVVRYSRVKEKGYARLVTNLGNINIELFCDQVPKTCENFLKLAARKYYDNTEFHRSIPYFMIQGGDPTGTGKGGESAWGPEPFKDEFKPHLSHSARGVLSMANSGPNTNKSQFFLTYRSCKHLDSKHSVFGRVVGGMDTLSSMESIGTDNKDRPVERICLERVLVFVDPFAKVDEQLAQERSQALDEARMAQERLLTKKKPEPKVYKEGVGKFISPSLKKEARCLNRNGLDFALCSHSASRLLPLFAGSMQLQLMAFRPGLVRLKSPSLELADDSVILVDGKCSIACGGTKNKK